MLRNTIILSVIGTVLMAIGCGGSAPANNKPANTNANTAPVITFATPAATPANVAADAPINANTASKTPAPANTSEKDVKKPAKPGATPASGIPDANAIKKSMGQQPPPPAANSNSSMMMMTKKKPANKP